MLFDKLSVVLPLYKCKEENFKLSICFESLNLVHQEIDRYVTMNSLYKLDQRLSLFTIAYFDGIIQSIYGNITTEIHKMYSVYQTCSN